MQKRSSKPRAQSARTEPRAAEGWVGPTYLRRIELINEQMRRILRPTEARELARLSAALDAHSEQRYPEGWGLVAQLRRFGAGAMVAGNLHQANRPTAGSPRSQRGRVR